jgi:5-methylthioadenosine/S-adenosylhomocysteine deaminase
MGLTIADVVLDGVTTTIRADGGIITAIGDDVEHVPGDDYVEARGMAAVPGLVNGHGHAAMTLFRGYGSDLQLQDVNDKIWPPSAADRRRRVLGHEAGDLEMVRSGTTLLRHVLAPEAVARAEDAGIRATVGLPLIVATRRPARCATGRSSRAESPASGPLVTASLTPHANYTVSAESMTGSADRRRAHLVVHIHLSETRRRCDWLVDHESARRCG